MLVHPNRLLARSNARTAAIVLRGIYAFTSGYEVEISWARQCSVPADDSWQSWQDTDSDDAGITLGFSYEPTVPTLLNPLLGTQGENRQPWWHPSDLWGGAAANDTSRRIARHVRARIDGVAPDGILTIGWYWPSQGIGHGYTSFDMPPAASLHAHNVAIWGP